MSGLYILGALVALGLAVYLVWALFRPEDGYCVDGPCAGDSLAPAPVSLIDGMVTYSG